MEKIINMLLFFKRQCIDIKTYGIRELLRKFYLLIKILLIIPFYIIAIVPCFIIRLISPWLIVRIIKLPAGNFGDFVQFAGMYYCKKEMKKNWSKKKYLDLVYIHYNDKVFNKQIAKMWKRKLNFLSGYLLDPISKINKLIPGWRIHAAEHLYEMYSSGKGNRDIENLYEKFQPLEFTDEEEIYGKKMLNKFGLKDGDKFVCLAVRDEAYQLKKISERYRDWSYHDFRHTDIDKFVLAAEELAKRGYYVFRMGVVVNKPMNSDNPKIIDYANSNLRSDFMDVYLGAKCSFCIATEFGFQELPVIFRRSLALLCVPLGNLRSCSEKFLHLTKHHVLIKEKRKLSLSEIFSHGVAYAYETKIFKQKGIELIENTPEEIKDLAIEMDESLQSNRKLNLEDEELQKNFQSLYASNIKNYECKDKNLMHGQIRCRYGTKFLRENKNWLR